MTERNQIGKKLRFEVFKRDIFACQYCGATPPSVILHVDHITPVALGGKNRIDNLITSCSSCNLGKGATPLSSIPVSLADKAMDAKEREEQILAYNKILTEIADRIDEDAWRVVAILECNPNADSYGRSELQSIKRFLEKLPSAKVFEAAEIAAANISYRSKKQFRYFCGVCWRMIRGD